MSAKFVGGAYDGVEMDHKDLNATALVVQTPTPSGLRVFVVLPPREGWEHIRRGEMTKEQAGSPRHTYERVFLPGGGAEYREAAASGALDEAMAAMYRPLSEEDQDRKRHFAEMADQFIARVRSGQVGPATLVTLVYQCADEDGNLAPPIRIPITPRVSINFPGHREEATRLALHHLLDGICENINANVRNAPTEFPGRAPDGRSLGIQGFDLEIESPES
jgi:hypothetical protein